MGATQLDQLLFGLSLIGITGSGLFAWLYLREVDRNDTMRQRIEALRMLLKLALRTPFDDEIKSGLSKDELHPLGDALLASTVGLRFPDEQRMVTAIREADHYDMQRVK